VQGAQLLEDGLELPVDVTDDDAARVSELGEMIARQTYIFEAIAGDGVGYDEQQTRWW
jgi:hypothetical protein